MEEFSLEEIEREVKILKELDHRNITKLLDYGYDNLVSGNRSGKVFYVSLELVSAGELFDFIALTGAFAEPVARYYFHQMINAIEYLHKHDIAHRDLKTENILLSKAFTLKICDFGYASTSATNKTQVGTQSYMAPEVLKGRKEYIGKQADVFGAGLILFQMVNKWNPFGKASARDPYYKYLAAGKADKFWLKHAKASGKDELSDEVKDLISKCMAYKPSDRPTIEEIKEHPWFEGTMPTKDDIKEEFRKRKQILEDENDAQKDEDKFEDYDTSAFDEVAHRGIGDDDEEECVERTLQEYDADAPRYTQFFSTSDVEELWKTLATYTTTVCDSFEISKEDFSITAKKALDEDEDNEGEESKSDEESENCVEFMINILQVPEEDKLWVEANLIQGEKFEFINIFKNMKGFFGGHANVVEVADLP